MKIKLFCILLFCNFVFNLPLVFSQNSYTVTFNANDGKGIVPSSQNVSAGSGFMLPNGNDLVAVIEFGIFSGWNTNADGTGTNYQAGTAYVPTGNTTLYANWTIITNLGAKFTWLQNNAQSNRSYTVEVNRDYDVDLNLSRLFILQFRNRNNITIILKGDNTNRTLRSGVSTLFSVSSGITFVLDNITLSGNPGSSHVSVSSGGTFIMNDGSRISGGFPGVDVRQGGNFIMNGGTISENGGNVGAGVIVFGTFTMNGGNIINNNANLSRVYPEPKQLGGGVAVFDNGTFIMTGGIISGNNASHGGGIYLERNANFTKTGGTIIGYTSNRNNGNAARQFDRWGKLTDTIHNGRGHSIYVSPSLRKETTSGPEDNMSYNGSNGSFGGSWDF